MEIVNPSPFAATTLPQPKRSVIHMKTLFLEPLAGLQGRCAARRATRRRVSGRELSWQDARRPTSIKNYGLSPRNERARELSPGRNGTGPELHSLPKEAIT